MSKKILKATHAGDLKIGDVSLQCSVLEDDTRVLSMRGINVAFGGTTGGLSGPKTEEKDGVRNLPRILASNSIKPFISQDLMARLTSPIEYAPEHGGRSAFGYEATLLPEICEVIIDANKDTPIRGHAAYVKVAEMLLRGFARVGIIALVDEVTGFQEIRDRKALSAILDKYLSKELAAWAKRFPDEFYREMFRLRGWAWNPTSVAKPSIVGRYTNDLIYDRLAPNILGELEKRNPKNESGNRSHRHHQWLTNDVGSVSVWKSEIIFAFQSSQKTRRLTS